MNGSSRPGNEVHMSKPKETRKEETMTRVVNKDELPQVINKDELARGKTARWFEGYRYGDVGVSFFLVESPPEGGAVLHTHPYEEVFITLEGEATFTVGGATIVASAGQIVVAPAGVPHKFVNSGTATLRQVDIHPSGRIEQTDIPENE